MADADMEEIQNPAKRPRFELDSEDIVCSRYSANTNVTKDDLCDDQGLCQLEKLLPKEACVAGDSLTTVSQEEVQTDVKEAVEENTEKVAQDIDAAVPPDDDAEDSDSDNVSEISDLSGLSEAGWRPITGPLSWVQRQMLMGVNPREVLKDLIPSETELPEDLNDMLLWRLIVSILSEPPKRNKLSHYNTLDDAVNLMSTCKKIMVLTGAGVSVPCGIPDFRSRDGIYARLAVDFPDLREPQEMFDIRFFMQDPRPFFKFAKEIYPGQFKPSRSHQFIRKIEENGKLLRNYTQNIDTLEQVAGISNVVQCHGSFATASCITCKHKVDADAIRDDIMNQIIPKCTKCSPESTFPIMKPDIVFFGEGLPEEFHRRMEEDKDDCDLLIVIGSSLKVRPVALVPNSLPAEVPQILINREPLRHLNFDIELLGDCDAIVSELCHRLGGSWKSLCSGEPLEEITKDRLPTPPLVAISSCDSKITNSHVSTFPRVMSNASNASETAGVRSELEAIHLQKTMSDESNDSACNELCTVNNETAASAKVSWSIGTISDNNPNAEMKLSRTTAQLLEDSGVCSRDSGTYEASTGAETDNDQTSDNGRCSAKLEEDGGRLASDDDIEVIEKCWQTRPGRNIASDLPDGTYMVLPPSRYIFPGAEVYADDDGENSDDESLHSSNANGSPRKKWPCATCHSPPPNHNGGIFFQDTIKSYEDYQAIDTDMNQNGFTDRIEASTNSS